MVIEIERARLIIQVTDNNIDDLDRQRRFSINKTEVESLWVDFKFHNYGRSPGILKYIFHAIKVHEASGPDWRAIRLFEPDDGTIIDTGTKSVLYRSEMDRPLTSEERRAIVTDQLRLSFYGKVAFDDIFGVEHKDNFGSPT